MLKYVEYIWLGVSIVLVIFLGTSVVELKLLNVVGIVIGITIASFMFAFRRRQRLSREKAEQEEMERLEKELEENDPE